MRNWFWIAAVLTLCWAAPHLTAAEASEGVPDIVKMAENGLGEDVMLAYIENSPAAYDPNVDEIIMLHDLGVSSKVISAMIDHGRLLRLQAAKGPEAALPPAPPAPASPEPLPPEPLAPEPEEAATPIQYAPGEGPVYEYEETEAERIVEAAPVTTVIYERSQPNVVYVPPDEGLNVSYFYESLSPYGRWMLLPGHGWVWQPTVVRVDPNWRPYFHGGHWVWTDHGWYWSSSYSWGWAPFHYGRWTYVRRYGWIWEPDTEWAPAWVHWRRSEDHCGWAPLPPGSRFEVGIGFSFRGKRVGIDFNFNLGERDYAFVPVNRFAERDLAPVCVRRDRARNVYNNTTIINNTYIYNDNRIINQGVPVASVAAATKQDFKPVQISAAKVAAGDTVAGEQQKPGQITVFRPKLQAQNTVDPQQAVARREAFQSRWQQEQKSGDTLQKREKELAAQGVAAEEAKRQAERDARKKVLEDVAKLPAAQLPAAKLVDPATASNIKKGAAQPGDDANAKRKAEWEAKRKADEATHNSTGEIKRAAEEAKKKADDAARQQAEAAKNQETAEEAKKKAEGDQAKLKIDLEAQARKQAEEARKKAAAAAHQQAEAAKKAADDAADEAKKKAEADQAKRKVDLEAQARKQAEEAKKKADDAARQQAEAAKKAADDAADEAKKKAEADQAKRKVDLEAQARKQAEEARKKADDAARQQAEAAKKAADDAADEAKKKAEADQAKRKVDLEAQARKQAEEARKKADDAARQQAEAAKKAADDARKQAEETARQQAAAEEVKKKAGADEARRKADLEAQRKAAEDLARQQAEAKRAADEAKKKTDDAARQQAEAAKRAAEEQMRRQAEAAKRAADEAAKRGGDKTPEDPRHGNSRFSKTPDPNAPVDPNEKKTP